MHGAAFAGAPAPRPETGGGGAPEAPVANLGAFTFQNGEVVEDFKVSYVTHGKLNAARDNVVLVMQHFTSDHRALDFMIGPGQALDTSKYYVVATDFISNAQLRYDVTTGPTNSGLNMDFPEFTILDSVNVDVRFLREYLGLEHIRAAIGASIGAMKAYQMALSHPDFVSGVIPINGSPKINPQMRAQLHSMMRIITLDPGWKGGNYIDNPIEGVVIALTSQNAWWFSPAFYDSAPAPSRGPAGFELMFWNLWSTQHPQDARDLYYQIRHWADFDIGDTPGFDGDTQAALAAIKTQMLVISNPRDLIVRPPEIAMVLEAVPQAVHFELDSDFGHITCCGFDPDAVQQMTPVIAKFLADLE
jgi:homoserine O-acetyltransferase